MERLFADLLEKNWRCLHNFHKRFAWKDLTAEFKAAIPADLAARVTVDTLRAKLHNERLAINKARFLLLEIRTNSYLNIHKKFDLII